ncbi:MAG: hypothetical protein M1835_002557 [Candelina submexicana]|nr:MAG: hypothetical protein M1835_002557 [Candelina submexicana]
MGLVDYSDSEGSEAENIPTTIEKRTKSLTSKANFQKVVDRSNPHKIRVTLPQASNAGSNDKSNADEPPAKRPRKDGGVFSGFNSFLPAPKRAAPSGSGESAGRSKGLGSGVNLKTGAAPAFSRNTDSEASNIDESSAARNEEVPLGGDKADEGMLKEPMVDTVESQESRAEPKKIGTPMMFKPLSVARKPQKKKPAIVPNLSTPEGPAPETEKASKTALKVSLFSMGGEQTSATKAPAPTVDEYKPMVFEPAQHEGEDHPYPPNKELDHDNGNQDILSNTLDDEVSVAPQIQSLDTIAADLNLSKSARRQLLGRQGNSAASAANIVNFNTDKEYAANEALRVAGETVQHNPVKAIAPGKHNLKQLVNAASNQKDALEEHFASGKRNKKEAGSKYGW